MVGSVISASTGTTRPTPRLRVIPTYQHECIATVCFSVRSRIATQFSERRRSRWQKINGECHSVGQEGTAWEVDQFRVLRQPAAHRGGTPYIGSRCMSRHTGRQWYPASTLACRTSPGHPDWHPSADGNSTSSCLPTVPYMQTPDSQPVLGARKEALSVTVPGAAQLRTSAPR